MAEPSVLNYSFLQLLSFVLLWAVIGGVPGFYLFYSRDRNPRLGASLGVVIGVGLGTLLSASNLLNEQTFLNSMVLLWLSMVLVGVFLPRGDHSRYVTIQQRVADLAYGLLMPTFIIVMAIVVVPMLWNLLFAFRPVRMRNLPTIDLFSLGDFTIDNFERIFASRGGQFWDILFTTVFYTLAGSILAILIGLVAALVVKDKFPGRNVFRGFLLFPYIAPVVSIAFIWQMFLNARFGLINEIVAGLGGTRTDFLTTPGWALLMIILFQGWRYFPFAFLFILARIQAIPDEMYEAAQVDGASPSQRLWHITLPQLRAVFGTLFLLRFIWTFNKFDDVFLLTGGIAGTEVLPVQIYNQLFARQNVGAASATAVVMAVILFIIVGVYFRWFLVEEV